MDQSNEEIVDLELLLDLENCALQDEESYFNWIDSNFNADAAKARIEKRQCPKLCLDIKECAFCQFDGEWRLEVEPTIFLDDLNREKGFFNKFIVWNSEMTFLECYIGEFQKGENRLDYMDLKIDQYCHQDRTEDDLEFVNGYKYLSETLQTYIQSRKECVNYSDLGETQHFADLHVQAKTAVLSVKFIFYKKSRNLHKQVPVLRKLIELDPLNAIWHEKLGSRLRCIRKHVWAGQGKPALTAAETIAFVKAYNLRPDEPKFFVSLSRNVAEMLKANNYKSLDQIICIDGTSELFNTVQDALNFMKTNTKFLLEAVDCIESKREFAEMVTTMGEVFSVGLPPQFHDIYLAGHCIQSAIEVCPRCSKSNHRMGLFQWKKQNNYESAVEHLTTAVTSKIENFYAVVDWCGLLMHQANKQTQVLEDIFNELLSRELSWTKKEAARLYFLKGCFLFIVKGNESDTIDSWVRAYKMNETSLHIIVAFSEARRFKWNKDNFNAEKILNFLKKFKLTENKEIAERIVNQIKKFQERQKFNHSVKDSIGSNNRVTKFQPIESFTEC